MARLLLSLMILWSAQSLAVIETYEFSSPELELRYKALSQELRCPKCQNQNIADSNAPISRDLRAIVHEQLEAGATDEEIIEFHDMDDRLRNRASRERLLLPRPSRAPRFVPARSSATPCSLTRGEG